MKFKQTKLGEVLGTLDKSQLKGLLKFVNYGDNNVSEKQKKYLADIVSRQISGNVIYEIKLLKKHFKNNTTQLNKAKTNILKETLNYLKLNLLYEEYFIGQYKLLEFFNSNNLKKNYASCYNQLKKYFAKKASYPDGILQNLENYYFKYLNIKATRINRKKINIEDIEKSAHLLDEYYIFEQLKMQCEIVNRSGIDGNKKRINATKNNFLLTYKTDDLIIQIYQNLLQLYSSENDEWELYKETGDLFFSKQKHLNSVYIEDILFKLINYCTQSINKGNHQYVKELWLHHKFLHNENKLFNKPDFDPFIFLNFVITGLMSNNFAWVKNFILEKENQLLNNEKDIKQKVLELSKVLCVFYNTNEKDRLDICHKKLCYFSSKDKLLNLFSQKLYLKILFEQQETHLLLYEIKRMKKYISNYNTIKGNYKNTTLNFLNTLKQLSLFNNEKIELNPSFFSFIDYFWLFEKITDKTKITSHF